MYISPKAVHLNIRSMITGMKQSFFLCVLIGSILVAAVVVPAFNMDGSSGLGVICIDGKALPASELVRTVEEASPSSEQMTYGSPDTPDITPQFQYQDNIYCLDRNTLVLESLSDLWSCVGSLNEFVFHFSDFFADFQTNRNDHVNCPVYASPENKGHLYLEFGSKYYPFVLKELTYPWIYYDGTLYLYENIYGLIFDPLPSDVPAFSPENALLLGQCASSTRYCFPSKELTSNDVSLLGKNMYYDSDTGAIYAELSNGTAGGKPRFDRYCPVSDDFFADFR